MPACGPGPQERSQDRQGRSVVVGQVAGVGLGCPWAPAGPTGRAIFPDGVAAEDIRGQLHGWPSLSHRGSASREASDDLHDLIEVGIPFAVAYPVADTVGEVLSQQ